MFSFQSKEQEMPAPQQDRYWFQDWCDYCGVKEARGKPSWHKDHFVPKSKGGSNDNSNLMLACPVCNAIKGSKLFADVRTALVLKRLGWPRFTQEQLMWLQAQGFDVSPVWKGKLYFEEHAHD